VEIKSLQDVETFVSGFEFLKPYAHLVAVGIVVVILTFFSLVLGELLPKRIGLNHPRSNCKSSSIADENYFDNYRAFYLVT
jgi:putative hemolysin